MWRERGIKKERGKRVPPTYYEKIEQDKQKHLCYEIIWQIGDMRDTGFVYTPEDANRAQDLLDEFAKYLLELREVCWKRPGSFNVAMKKAKRLKWVLK